MKIGIYLVDAVDKKGNTTNTGEVISKIMPIEELQADIYFIKKCVRVLKLKEKPHKFAINFKREIKSL